jgi:carbonyl reductase 1
VSKTAVVTGANQGLGFALVRGLCKALPAGSSVYLTARDPSKGEAAVKVLESEGLHPTFHQLDVTKQTSIDALAATLRRQHGGIDIMISNAGARIDRESSQAAQVRGFFETNNFGSTRVIQAFRGLLNDGGRFLVVASGFGQVRRLPVHLQDRFKSVSNDLGGIDATMHAYVDAVETGNAVAEGWPDWINVPSKIGQVAAMRAYAAQVRDEASRRDWLINAVCPGLVDTDASRPWFADMSNALSPDTAAKDVIWLATLPPGTREPYGVLVQHRKELDW